MGDDNDAKLSAIEAEIDELEEEAIQADLELDRLGARLNVLRRERDKLLQERYGGLDRLDGHFKDTPK